MQITDLYKQLFGRKGPADGNVIDMSEHGRVGGLSTGQPFKYTVPIDPDTGVTLTGGAGTQYTEGNTDASITGNALMWEDAADTLVVASATKPLPVSASIDTTGLATDAVDTNTAAIQTAVEAIQAAVEGTLTVTGGGGGVEYTEGDTDASITGSALLWEDTGDTLRAVSAAKPLPISDAGGSITVDGTVAVTNAGITTIAGAVSGTEMQVDVLTMPTTTVTATDLDIRNLTNADVVTAELSAVDNAVLDTIAAKDFATQTTLAAINAKLVTGTDIGDVTINNSTGAAAVNIQDGGNTITVDGTVTANLSATDNAVLDQIELNQDSQTAILTTIDTDTGAMATDLAAIEVLLTGIGADTDAIKTATQLIDNAISGSEMQVDVVAALPAGTNAIGKLAANSGVDIGDVDVTSIAAGSNLIGNVGIGVRTSGGATPFYNLDVDESEDAIKATAGQLYEIYCNNTTAAQIFVKLYNATTANVTVGTTTPVMVIPVPGNADSDGAGVVRQWPMGLAFDTAITIAATTGAADNDTGAPGAGAIIVSGAYN